MMFKAVYVCVCVPGWLGAWCGLQREHGLHRRSGASHGRRGLSGCLQVTAGVILVLTVFSVYILKLGCFFLKYIFECCFGSYIYFLEIFIYIVSVLLIYINWKAWSRFQHQARKTHIIYVFLLFYFSDFQVFWYIILFSVAFSMNRNNLDNKPFLCG